MMERTKTISGVTSQHARPVSSPEYLSKYLIHIRVAENILLCGTGRCPYVSSSLLWWYLSLDYYYNSQYN
jgi:hypothetical protein